MRKKKLAKTSTAAHRHGHKFPAYEYFPLSEGVDKASLQISDVGRYSISKPGDADDITGHIACYLKAVLRQRSLKSVTDGTACVGGNTLSFLRRFTRVVAIELDPLHYQMLSNNVHRFGYKSPKIKTLHGDVTKLLANPVVNSSQVLFLDPPWNSEGDVWYTQKHSYMLYLSGVPIDVLAKQVLRQSSVILLALKVPFNFDFKRFVKTTVDLLIMVSKVGKFYLILCSQPP